MPQPWTALDVLVEAEKATCQAAQINNQSCLTARYPTDCCYQRSAGAALAKRKGLIAPLLVSDG